MAPIEAFPANLKRARLARGLTQHQLAQLVDKREGDIRRWERGRNEPDFSTAVTLAEALGVSLDELVRAGAEEALDAVAKRAPRRRRP